MVQNMAKKLMLKALFFLWAKISIILFPLMGIVIVVAIIASVLSPFRHRETVQQDFFASLFNPYIPYVANHTRGSYMRANFIVWARDRMDTVNVIVTDFMNNYTVRNADDGGEGAGSIALRIVIAYYVGFLDLVSPQGLPQTSQEILHDMNYTQEFWDELEQDWEENFDEGQTQADFLWLFAPVPNRVMFVRSFFSIEYVMKRVYEYGAIYDDYGDFLYYGYYFVGYEYDPPHYADFNWELHNNLIAPMINFITSRMGFVDFDGQFAPPVYPERFHNITSPFGYRLDPFGSGRITFHNGVDWAWGEDTYGSSIFAVYSGEVIREGWENNGFGIQIWIRHNANGQVFYSVYAHNSDNFVRVGQTVQAGQLIAQIGNTGQSTAPHLHLSILVGGSWVDPMSLWE